MDRVDIITGTLGKALGGASGGFTSGRAEIVEMLRQRSRPYLFSNTVPPPIVAGALKALELVATTPELRTRLATNTKRFRTGLLAEGFDVRPGETPIIPVMMYDAKAATALADEVLKQGVYVVAFSYPVVPKGQARIRTQMSAGLSEADVDFAIAAFAKAKSVLGL